MRYITIFTIILISAFNSFAQSRRVNPNRPPLAPPVNSVAAETSDLTAEQMFTEASTYAMTKYAEYEQKKITYNKTLHEKTQRDQKQLAAKYATVLALRQNLTNDDIYHLGMLNWVAENFENADETMRKYLASEDKTADKAQTARSVLVVVAARRKNFDEAEKVLAEYLNNDPIRMRERAKMDTELAVVYREDKKLDYGGKTRRRSLSCYKSRF